MSLVREDRPLIGRRVYFILAQWGEGGLTLTCQTSWFKGSLSNEHMLPFLT